VGPPGHDGSIPMAPRTSGAVQRPRDARTTIGRLRLECCELGTETEPGLQDGDSNSNSAAALTRSSLKLAEVVALFPWFRAKIQKIALFSQGVSTRVAGLQ